MRRGDLNGGSIKALLLLLLIAANVIAALPNDRARLFPGSARASRAAFGATPNALGTSDAKDHGTFSAKAPQTAREARALPAQPPH